VALDTEVARARGDRGCVTPFVLVTQPQSARRPPRLHEEVVRVDDVDGGAGVVSAGGAPNEGGTSLLRSSVDRGADDPLLLRRDGVARVLRRIVECLLKR
jgi:hypothetical protein